MNKKRIIPCLDVRDGRVVKGVRFEGLNDVAAPEALAQFYCDQGADELVFYDITASDEGRKPFTDALAAVAARAKIPLTLGGGIATLEDFGRALEWGADKVSINSGAIKNPRFIEEAAKEYGSARVVLAADVKRVGGQYRVFARGGRADTGMDAVEWLRAGAARGAGEIVVNSIDTDGVKGGYDIELLKAVCAAVHAPVVASGGAGKIEDFVELFQAVPEVGAGLAASVFHFGEVKIPELKRALEQAGVPVRRA